MLDEHRQLAGLGILRLPAGQLFVVMQEQPGQILGIGGVVVGPTGDKGFAEALEADRIDGVEIHPLGVSLQRQKDGSGGLFEADRQASPWEAGAQAVHPVLERFGSGGHLVAVLASGGDFDQVQIDFSIGTIEPEGQIEGRNRSEGNRHR